MPLRVKHVKMIEKVGLTYKIDVLALEMDSKWNTVKNCLISGSVRMMWEDFGLSECKSKFRCAKAN